MSDHDQKPPLLMPRAQRRFLEAAERIRLNQPTFDDLAYMARELVQVTLPHRNPGDVPAWSRSSRNHRASPRGPRPVAGFSPSWNMKSPTAI